MTEAHPRVRGHCPMGCGETLILDDGYVTCSRTGPRSCPRPDAVATLLEDPETHHIVQIREDEFTVRHPLRERLDDALMDCDMQWIAALDGPPRKPGRYRVRWAGAQPSAPSAWEEIS